MACQQDTELLTHLLTQRAWCARAWDTEAVRNAAQCDKDTQVWAQVALQPEQTSSWASVPMVLVSCSNEVSLFCLFCRQRSYCDLNAKYFRVSWVLAMLGLRNCRLATTHKSTPPHWSSSPNLGPNPHQAARRGLYFCPSPRDD